MQCEMHINLVLFAHKLYAYVIHKLNVMHISIVYYHRLEIGKTIITFIILL